MAKKRLTLKRIEEFRELTRRSKQALKDHELKEYDAIQDEIDTWLFDHLNDLLKYTELYLMLKPAR